MDIEPLAIQFLGESGLTHACLKGMVSILTSPYPPSGVTVVFKEMDADETTTDVCFVVWEWIGSSPTIVSDGFGTHMGEGGRGFATVCDLLRLYGIPLQEHWAEREQFDRIAYGYPTEDDLEQLHQALPVVPSHLLSLTEFERQLWREEPRFAAPFPYWLLEPELVEDAKEIRQSHSRAVFQVTRRLEMIIRKVCALPESVAGELLLHTTLSEKKPLELYGSTTYEVESWFHLFQGMIGAFKEPHAHSEHPLSRSDAIAQILMINHLLQKLKRDHPDVFEQL